jgi:hypothetical protein
MVFLPYPVMKAGHAGNCSLSSHDEGEVTECRQDGGQDQHFLELELLARPVRQ